MSISYLWMFLTINISLDFFSWRNILRSLQGNIFTKNPPQLPAAATITRGLYPQISHLLCPSTVWLCPLCWAVELISLPWNWVGLWLLHPLHSINYRGSESIWPPQQGHKEPCSFSFGLLECPSYGYSLATFMLGTKLPWTERSKLR